MEHAVDTVRCFAISRAVRTLTSTSRAVPSSNAFALGCGHFFCRECWKKVRSFNAPNVHFIPTLTPSCFLLTAYVPQYLHVKVKDGSECVATKCIMEGCGEVCGEDVFKQVLEVAKHKEMERKRAAAAASANAAATAILREEEGKEGERGRSSVKKPSSASSASSASGGAGGGSGGFNVNAIANVNGDSDEDEEGSGTVSGMTDMEVFRRYQKFLYTVGNLSLSFSLSRSLSPLITHSPSFPSGDRRSSTPIADSAGAPERTVARLSTPCRQLRISSVLVERTSAFAVGTTKHMLQYGASTWLCGSRSVGTTPRLPTGSSPTQSAARNATLASRRTKGATI